MSNWEIGIALGALGLTDEQRQTVEAAIPDMQALVSLINANMKTINHAVALFNRVAPAAKIVADAIAAKEAGG